MHNVARCEIAETLGSIVRQCQFVSMRQVALLEVRLKAAKLAVFHNHHKGLADGDHAVKADNVIAIQLRHKTRLTHQLIPCI